MQVLRLFVLLWLWPLLLQAQESELSLGAIFDLSSGPGATWGSAERDGFLLAIQEFQAQNPRTKITYEIEDSAYKNTQAISGFQKLTAVRGYRFVVGPTWEAFLAIQPLCERGKILCLAVSCNNGAFDDPTKRYSLSAWLDERDYTRIIAQRLNDLRLKNVGVIATITPYHDLLVQELEQTLSLKPVAIERVGSDLVDSAR